MELKNYSESAWRRQCGCVTQEGYVFSNSIAENIALCDDVPDMRRVRKAADVANVREWIEKLPLGYNTKIGADGHVLSVGQKQRILIARAVYKNSPYLFFDEATNSLDANAAHKAHQVPVREQVVRLRTPALTEYGEKSVSCTA